MAADFGPSLGNYRELKPFRFWCQKVLPLVYDDSLSYYEVLCKVVDYINALIESDKQLSVEINGVYSDLNNIKEWISSFDKEKLLLIIREEVNKYIATSIFVEISDTGYFIFYVPEAWKDINFKTSGLDIYVENLNYGHLILKY